MIEFQMSFSSLRSGSLSLHGMDIIYRTLRPMRSQLAQSTHLAWAAIAMETEIYTLPMPDLSVSDCPALFEHISN